MLVCTQALSDDFTNQLALHNSGYKLFSPDRGSPAFWEEKKKEVFAMIRQLGTKIVYYVVTGRIHMAKTYCYSEECH